MRKQLLYRSIIVIIVFFFFSSPQLIAKNSLSNNNSDISGLRSLVPGVGWEQIKEMIKSDDRIAFNDFVKNHIKEMTEMYPEIETCVSAYFVHNEIEQLFSNYKSEVGIRICTKDPEKAGKLFDFIKDVEFFSNQSSMQDMIPENGEKVRLFINVLDEKNFAKFKSKRKNESTILIVVPYMPDYEDMKKLIFETIFHIDDLHEK
jgi:hypothetical protein